MTALDNFEDYLWEKTSWMISFTEHPWTAVLAGYNNPNLYLGLLDQTANTRGELAGHIMWLPYFGTLSDFNWLYSTNISDVLSFCNTQSTNIKQLFKSLLEYFRRNVCLDSKASFLVFMMSTKFGLAWDRLKFQLDAKSYLTLHGKH